MLEIKVTLGEEQWDETEQCFLLPEEQTLNLEHSLVSLSKWESKWCKPFLSKNEMSTEEAVDYIKCMTVDDVPQHIYDYLTNENIVQIRQYINSPMTATWFAEDKTKGKSREVVTAELIYYWMIALNIPFDPCQNWHLNRLLTLIRVCNVKNAPPKKMSKRDIMSRNTALNAARRQSTNSKG